MTGDFSPRPAKCPNCGANMDLGLLDNTRDKVANCSHCATTVDLPDAQGKTWKRQEERPDGTVVNESRTEWSSNSPMPGYEDFPPDESAADGAPFSLSIDGKEFKTIEEARAHLLTVMPPEMVEHMLSAMKGGDLKMTRNSTNITTSTSESTHYESSDKKPPI